VDLKLCKPENGRWDQVPFTDGAPFSAADFDQDLPYLATPLPAREADHEIARNQVRLAVLAATTPRGRRLRRRQQRLLDAASTALRTRRRPSRPSATGLTDRTTALVARLHRSTTASPAR
jgi:hypothetical protein